ncbi:MAG: response regulator, partial [Steroidobacteraceae bacterium]
MDLLVLIRESAALFAVLDVKHKLRLELPVTLPTVQADAEQIRGALGNLLSNAFKYSPQGGDVVMGARVEHDEVLLWVSDQGLGIPANALPHLFTKFYRVDNTASHSVGGTGLGLALVKQIIEFHRGRVWAESEYGEGTTFFIALPRLPQAAQGDAPAAVAPPSSIQSLDILVVEDDSAFANLLLEHFRGAGLSVQQTGFAEQALEWCRQSAPRMLLLDIHLAGAMDGWDLLVALKTDEALQAIPVVVMSSSDPNMHGLALGGADYVLKSATQEALLQAVQRQVPKLQGKTLLIADDDAIFRTRLSHLLVSLQAEVRQAANGFEAMERIAEAVPDLLILDLLMPVLDGFEVLRR